MVEERPISEADLHAYVDRQTAGERCAEIETWLASRPEEAERVADYRRLTEALRAAYNPVLEEPVPQHLERAARQRWRWPVLAAAAGLVAFGIALGAVGQWALRESSVLPARAPEELSLARRAAVAHAVYSPEVRRPVEVGADQEQQLVNWLSKRLGMQVRAPKLEAVGLALIGGRLLPGEVGPVAQLMYQNQSGGRLTLYVRVETGKLPETAFRYARENNVRVFYWIDRGSGYAIASSDLSKEELLRAATLIYKQLEQP